MAKEKATPLKQEKLKVYNFPLEGVTVYAKDLEDAHKKLSKNLSPKIEKEDD